MFFVVFLSGITMYFFIQEVTKNKKIALLAGIFYIFAPYRLTDMYVRNALAELTSFVFIPFVFHRTIWCFKRKVKKRISSHFWQCWTNFNPYYTYSICSNYLLALFIDTNQKM